jgi:hypothetical protein
MVVRIGSAGAEPLGISTLARGNELKVGSAGAELLGIPTLARGNELKIIFCHRIIYYATVKSDDNFNYRCVLATSRLVQTNGCHIPPKRHK